MKAGLTREDRLMTGVNAQISKISIGNSRKGKWSESVSWKDT